MEAGHLALVIGDGPRYRFIDPLQRRNGEVSPVPVGIYYYPENRRVDDESCWGNEELPELLKTPWGLLTIDDVMRHIEYLDSPSGFFEYYADGQMIFCHEKDAARVGFSAQVVDGALDVRVTFGDPMPLLFTYGRTFSLRDGRLSYKDRKLLHAGHSWVTPNDILYTEDDTGCAFGGFSGTPRDGAEIIAYLRHVAHGTFSKQELIAHHGVLCKRMDGLIAELDLLNAALEREHGRVSLSMPPSDLIDATDSFSDRFAYAETLEPQQRWAWLDYDLFKDRFKAGRVRAQRSYFKPTPDTFGVLHRMCAQQYHKVEERAHDFFSSSVLHKLLDQYVEACVVRQERDRLLPALMSAG
jgi:hypothetical protein